MENKKLAGQNDEYATADNTNNNSQVTPPTFPVKTERSQSFEAENSSLLEPTFLQRIFSWRSFIVLILHLGYATTNAPVIIMSMALVCMCGPVQPPSHANNVSNSSLGNGSDPNKMKYEFNWDSETRGLLISSYSFLGIVTPQLANFLRGYLGNKRTLALFSGIQAALMLLAPVAARFNLYSLLAVRIMTGLTINAQVPISGDTLAWWIPVKEKLTSVTFVVTGWMTSGSILPLIAGYLCLIHVDGGWTFIFYFNGGLTALWTLAWYFLTSRKPESHPFISEKEKNYILATRAAVDGVVTKEVDKTPYRIILTSVPVWAFILSMMFFMWSMVIVLTCFPLYFTSVLKFSLQEAGVVFSVESVIRIPSALCWSAFGNWLLRRRSMTTNTVRKICLCCGQVLSGSFFLAASFLDHNSRWAACVLVILGVGSLTAVVPLTTVIPLDMAPRYAGFISALGSSSCGLASISAPLIVAAITKKGLHEEWRVVLISMTAVHFSSSLIFLLFGNSSIQPWALKQKDNTTLSVQTDFSDLQEHSVSANTTSDKNN